MGEQIPFPGKPPQGESKAAEEAPVGSWSSMGPIPINMMLTALQQIEAQGFEPRFAAGPFAIQEKSKIMTPNAAPVPGFVIFSRKNSITMRDALEQAEKVIGEGSDGPV